MPKVADRLSPAAKAALWRAISSAARGGNHGLRASVAGERLRRMNETAKDVTQGMILSTGAAVSSAVAIKRLALVRCSGCARHYVASAALAEAIQKDAARAAEAICNPCAGKK